MVPTKLLSVLFLLFLFVATAYTKDKTIVFLGDSLTAGYGLAEEEAYPALIQRLLTEKKLDWRVVNAGISGDTTRGGLKRLDWILKSSPTIVFVALGANDGLRGFDVSHTKSNLEEMIKKLRSSGVAVILSGMKLPMNYGLDYRIKFEKLFSDLSKKYEIALYPFLLKGVAMDSKYNLPDGLHPNQIGQEKMAHQIFGFLKTHLENIEDH